MLFWHRLVRNFSTVREAQTSNYVRRMKVLDNWKINDPALAHHFDRSNMVVMIDQRPLVTRSGQSIELVIGSTENICHTLADYGLQASIRNSVLLDALPGEDNEFTPLFGCSLKTLEPPRDSGMPADEPRKRLAGVLGGSLINLRFAMLTMTSELHRNWVAKMQTLAKWSNIYNYCPKCSSSLRMRHSKTGASCSLCDRVYYPTISPVAIVLVHDESSEHCLLVRHSGSMNGVYTSIAGFAETGESLEDAVRREVAEEVGLEVDNVRYMGMSQPWPMPDSSLMTAFVARASMNDKLDIAPDELQHAGWFNKNEVRLAIQCTDADVHLKGMLSNKCEPNVLKYVPPSGAIAHRMITFWANS